MPWSLVLLLRHFNVITKIAVIVVDVGPTFVQMKTSTRKPTSASSTKQPTAAQHTKSLNLHSHSTYVYPIPHTYTHENPLSTHKNTLDRTHLSIIYTTTLIVVSVRVGPSSDSKYYYWLVIPAWFNFRMHTYDLYTYIHMYKQGINQAIHPDNVFINWAARKIQLWTQILVRLSAIRITRFNSKYIQPESVSTESELQEMERERKRELLKSHSATFETRLLSKHTQSPNYLFAALLILKNPLPQCVWMPTSSSKVHDHRCIYFIQCHHATISQPKKLWPIELLAQRDVEQSDHPHTCKRSPPTSSTHTTKPSHIRTQSNKKIKKTCSNRPITTTIHPCDTNNVISSV